MELLLIAIALAMDSVAVSIASGSKYKDIDFLQALKIAFIFGFFQGFMPYLGYLGGSLFAGFVDSIDHYIAFVVLVYLGYRMIQEARSEDFEDEVKDLSNKALLFLGVATSIDALAVGVTFSFMDINILIASSTIMVTTFLLCVIAVYIGKKLGGFLESKAEYLGGIILVILGFKILIEGINS